MRDDLLDAEAAINWAVSQFPLFEAKITKWLNDNIEARVEKLKPPASHRPIIIRQKSSFPLVFNAEFGAYINSIRSSLDILATSLNVRYSACRPDDAYFPVARSASVFASGNYKGHKLIKGLPATERAIIESLKPYDGGNQTLYTLHHLDIMRKHRRLIDVSASPANFHMTGSPNALWNFIPISVCGPIRGDNEYVIGLVSNNWPDYKIKISPHIAINEVGRSGERPVIADLSEFASLAHSIIKLFDVPD